MDIKSFLNAGYTAYHNVVNVYGMLKEKGFCELQLGEKWNLAPSGKYFVTRNAGSVVAFKLGKNKVFNVCVSHTDSPALKIKGNQSVSNDGIFRLNAEKYGSSLLYTFLDRPLKIAGRLFVEKESGVAQRLAVSDYNVVIPSLAIHHNPTANESLSLRVQSDMLPFLGQAAEDVYLTLTDEKVIDGDLYAVSAEEAFFAGANGEFLCSPRLDNLTSVYASVSALADCEPKNIAVAACLDNEEIGSGTRHGNPSFLSAVISQISEALEMDSAERLFAAENGMALSVDNVHAAHPAHPEKSDPKYRVRLNGGIVVKHHPNYATDAQTSAALKRLISFTGAEFQDYYNNSDVRSGSTLGLAVSRELGIKTCDIGLAQLAMHSACETCGSRDVENMQKCLAAFLSAEITGRTDVEIKL